MRKALYTVRNTCFIASIAAMCWIIAGCHTGRKLQTIQTAFSKKDTIATVRINQAALDSMKMVNQTMANLLSKRIDFTTFSAKIKVEYEDSHGKQPNTTAYVRIIKDSMIWVSLYATVFNIEAFRILITKDSVFVLDKINKEAQQR